MAETEEENSVEFRDKIRAVFRNKSPTFVISSWNTWILKYLTELIPQVDEYAADRQVPCQQPEPFPPLKPGQRSGCLQEDDA